MTSDVKLSMWTRYKQGKDRRKDIKKSKTRLENDLVREMGGTGSIYVASDDEEEQLRLATAISREECDFQQEVGMRYATFGHESGTGSSSAPIASSSGSHKRPRTVHLGLIHLLDLLPLSSLGLTPP